MPYKYQIRKSKDKKTHHITKYKRHTKIRGGAVGRFSSNSNSDYQYVKKKSLFKRLVNLFKRKNKKTAQLHSSKLSKLGVSTLKTINSPYKLTGVPILSSSNELGVKSLIHHYWYTIWPDHGVPKHSESLMQLVIQVLKNMKTQKKNVVVHCSAGVGRTGTFITLLHILHKYPSKQPIETEQLLQEINTFIVQMRERRTLMVQTLGQYIFIFKTLYSFFNPNNKLNRSIDESLKKIYRQFENYPKDTRCSHLDRYSNIGTVNTDYQLYIEPDLIHEDYCLDYINGTLMDELDGIKIFATQCPIPETKLDFQKMCINNNVGQIVMLTGLVEGINPKTGEPNIKCHDYFEKDLHTVHQPIQDIPGSEDVELRYLQFKLP